MLRSGRKISKRKNTRNVRKKNELSTDTSTDRSSSSSDSDSSHNDSLLDSTSVSSLDEDSTSPIVGRKLRTRRKQLNSKSKRSNKENDSSNRNSRSSNVLNTRKSQHRNDSHVAGPSRINDSSRRSRPTNSNNRTAKRKYKDRRNESRSSESEQCCTSSEDLPDDVLFPIKKKRMKQVNLHSSESDDSIVQPISSRRPTLLDSESSTSTCDEIRISGRLRVSNRHLLRSWSDSTSNSNASNSTRESSSSPPMIISKAMENFIQSSDSNSSNSSSTISNSLSSVDSEAMNMTSMLDSETSSYNTAQSNNVKDQSTDSDSSDSDGEKCAICLKKFRNQLIGNPSNCEHNFCAPCLKKWSESSTTCPVDRSTFDSIVIRGELNGPIIDRVKVENRNFGIFPPLDMDEVLLNDDSINCEICGSGEDEETLLLCDFCNLGYHMACLSPPLPAIPAGSWYCPSCTELHSNPTMNMNELFPDLPMRPVFLFHSNRRPTRTQAATAGSRSTGRLPMGRGPRRTVQNSSGSGLQDLSNVIESFVASINGMTPARSRRKKKRRTRNSRGSANRAQQLNAAENAEALVGGIDRIVERMTKRASSVFNPRPITRPSGPSEIVDMVFPSFSLFGGDDLEYFSDEQGGDDMEGEVAIMRRVRNEYSARRVENRKNLVSSLMDNYHDRVNPTVVETESSSSANLLDSILESQTLWHSKNVEIKSKKDGTLEIKMKDESNKKPDLTNTNHTSKEIPLYPNKSDGASENKSYTNNNSRYSSLASGSTGGGNSFAPSTSSFNSLNPSTRPGFSNLLGNNSSALDLSPFRGSAPIRFRMNPPRPAMRRQNYNSNSQRQQSSSTNLTNSVQSPKKGSGVSNADDDVDLYDDIDTENVESEKSQEIFTSLEPPPEPPALLIGSDSSSDDEDNGLVIDDKAVNSTNRSNIYDPTEPNEDSDSESNQDKNSNIVPGYLRSPSYGGLSEFGPHLPLPEPPALPMELDSVKDSDEEEETECPNMTLYSSTSINLANNVQDIPIPEAVYPQDELDCIPIPTSSPGDDDAIDDAKTKDNAVIENNSKLYSPTDKHDSESEIEEITSYHNSPSPRSRNGDLSDEPSISSRGSSQDRLSDRRRYSDESDRSDYYERVKKRKPRKIKNKTEKRENADGPIIHAEIIDVEKLPNEKSLKQIDLTEADDSNDEKEEHVGSDSEHRLPIDDAKLNDDQDDEKRSPPVEEIAAKKSDDESDAEANEPVEAASPKSVNDKTDTEDERKDPDAEVAVVEEAEKDKSDKEDNATEASADPDTADAIPDNDSATANSGDVNASGNHLLPSEDLDPVSDVEYNDFPDCQKASIRDKRKKRKKTRRRDSSTDNKTAEPKELEEGEIEDERSKRKYAAAQKRRGRTETPDRSPDRKQKKRRDRKDKSAGKENKESGSKGDEPQWKKLTKTTKERNYRDGKSKPADKLSDKNKERELKSKKEKRKEIERYDVRKIVSDKPRTTRDEFGRDVSANRSRSRTRSRSLSYGGRRRSKGTLRRSFSQDDRWIDWSPVWTQRRSRSRTRRTRSRSRNRSRLSGDRYGTKSKNRDREYDKRESRKRKRSVSAEIEKYTPPPAELKKRRRSRDRSRKSESYAPVRPSGREMPDYYYERSWSRSISYASLTPEPEQYVRYSRSPSIIEQPTRIPLLTPDHERNLMTPNPQNLTVIVPNVDIGKKKHKKKKESKKKKKKQPSKEVFTSGDNIVVSVNFDDNQKIISAKSSKRKHDDDKVRKKKKDESRKKRKQTLQVSDEVLNAKPVAVIDLNTSPCKEMSPTEVISLTDSGDETNANENCVIPADRRISQEYGENKDANKSPERRAYVMTQSGPKTPPEPPIKFTVNSTAPLRPLATNPIFEQDEIDREGNAVHYNKGPNTPPEPANQTRRSMSPNATMYDPFEPTKSRSQTPENAQIYEERKDNAPAEERRPVIDMFSEDNDKPSENKNAEKAKPQDDAKETIAPKPSAAGEDTQSVVKSSPAKETVAATDSTNEATQSNGGNTLVLDLSSLGDDYVPKSSIPLVKTSQGKYEFQSGKAADKPITVVISPQSQPPKPQPQQVMVTPTRQIPTKPVEPMKPPPFPDVMSWKPPPISQPNFSTPPPTITSLPATNLVTPSKSAPGLLTQNGGQDESSFEVDDSPYSPASSEGDDLFEPPPLNASTSSPGKQRPSPLSAVNSYKSRVDALFGSSPIKKIPPRGNVPPHVSKPVSAIKGTKKIVKPAPMSSKKEVGIRADEEQLKILDDVPNSAVEMIVKEKFLKKLHRQERVVEEVKVVLKPHYAKKHITKEEYKDILRRAVPKICHNKSGDINPSKIQGLVEAYVKKIRHSKKKPTMGAGMPLFPPMKTGGGKPMKQQKSLWG